MPPRNKPFSNVKPAALKFTFDAWCARRGVQVAALGVEDAIRLFAAYHDEIPVPGRKQGTHADMLLFQAGGGLEGPRWCLNLTRQLYSRGRGHQLALDLWVDRAAHAPPDGVTMWSSDHPSVASWVDAAIAAWRGMTLDDSAIVERKVYLAEF